MAHAILLGTYIIIIIISSSSSSSNYYYLICMNKNFLLKYIFCVSSSFICRTQPQRVALPQSLYLLTYKHYFHFIWIGISMIYLSVKFYLL